MNTCTLHTYSVVLLLRSQHKVHSERIKKRTSVCTSTTTSYDFCLSLSQSCGFGPQLHRQSLSHSEHSQCMTHNYIPQKTTTYLPRSMNSLSFVCGFLYSRVSFRVSSRRSRGSVRRISFCRFPATRAEMCVSFDSWNSIYILCCVYS